MKILIRNGTIVTATDTCRADILVDGEKVAAVGRDLNSPVDRVYDAAGRYILPGAIDVHTHFDMPFGGTVTADDFQSGTVAAAFGGTTTIVDYAIQSKGQSLAEAVAAWQKKAEGKAVIDYGFHVAITDLTESVFKEIPGIVAAGITSLKLFMAYKGTLQVDDGTLYRTLVKARECGALVCVHAENGDVIDVLVRQMLAAGQVAPLYHALSRPPALEGEATGRVITLAEMAGAPVYIVHLSAPEALEKVRAARDRGGSVFAETCPQYLYLSLDNYKEPDFQGAKYVMSPPLREKETVAELWRGISSGDLQVIGSDHCSFNMAQKRLGQDDFSKIPNGAPGVENRLMLMYYGGVVGKRIGLNRFVDLVATAPARLFGLFPGKGTIAAGSDADLVVFDPEAEFTISAATHHQNVDYNPYEGLRGKGVPVQVFSRGELIVDHGQFLGRAGRGRYLQRQPFSLSRL